MKRHMVLAQLAVFGAISVLIIFYTVFNLLQVHPFNGPFTVTVQLRSAGGIFQDAEVAYRGVQVGKVDSVDLHPDGVTVRLAIDHGTKIPDNAVAHVYDLSAVGEQYVSLVPSRDTGSYLHDGSVIPESRTTVPLETATVLYDLEQLVDSLNPADVRIIGQEGAAAFAGTGPQLKSILADATTIIDQLSASEPNTIDLLKNAALLLHGAAAHSAEFDQFATSLKTLSTTLAASTPTIETFLQQAEPTTRLVDNVIASNGSAISVLLGNLATLSDIQVARIPGLKSLLVAVPEFGRLAPTLVHDGKLSISAKLNIGEPVCPSGVPLTNPISGKRSPLYSIGCNLNLARGANNAPRPGGGASGATASAQLLPSGTQTGGYDPATGIASTANGTLVRLGTSGGQSQVLGPNSWQALLVQAAGG